MERPQPPRIGAVMSNLFRMSDHDFSTGGRGMGLSSAEKNSGSLLLSLIFIR